MIRINFSQFGQLADSLKKHCPTPPTLQSERDQFMNTYMGMVLFKEGTHINQTATIPPDSKRLLEAASAYAMLQLMNEVVWTNPCLEALWGRVKAGTQRFINRMM